MAGKPSDDDFMRMARESVMRMADSRGDSMPGNPPADASGALNDSRSQALRSQLEVSGGQSMGAGGKVGAEFREGDRFAKRFTIRALIAQGGMGAVYRAMDENTGEIVALKTIRPDLVNSPEAVERFLSEGKVTRRLAHPGIARVFDIDKAEGRWFIAMEFVRGQTLRDWMRSRDAKGARISVKDALWAARKILDVLSYLHAQGIIHRDLKPENIIVGKAEDGSGNFLKIIDFGLARSLAGNGPQLTATGAAMGTFAYMSPEQRAGKPLDERTDIYSAAVIIYEMLTGVAYDGNWEELTERRTDLPRAVRVELKRALSKFPDQRHRDATELMDALLDSPIWSKPIDYGRDAGDAVPQAAGTQSANKVAEFQNAAAMVREALQRTDPPPSTPTPPAKRSGYQRISASGWAWLLFLIAGTCAYPLIIVLSSDGSTAKSKQAYTRLEAKGRELDSAIENEIDALNRYAGKLEGYGVPADPGSQLSALRQARIAIPKTIQQSRTASKVEIEELCKDLEIQGSIRGFRIAEISRIDLSELLKGTELGRQIEVERETRKELEKFRVPYDEAVRDTNSAMKALAVALREYAASR